MLVNRLTTRRIDTQSNFALYHGLLAKQTHSESDKFGEQKLKQGNNQGKLDLTILLCVVWQASLAMLIWTETSPYKSAHFLSVPGQALIMITASACIKYQSHN